MVHTRRQIQLRWRRRKPNSNSNGVTYGDRDAYAYSNTYTKACSNAETASDASAAPVAVSREHLCGNSRANLASSPQGSKVEGVALRAMLCQPAENTAFLAGIAMQASPQRVGKLRAAPSSDILRLRATSRHRLRRSRSTFSSVLQGGTRCSLARRSDAKAAQRVGKSHAAFRLILALSKTRLASSSEKPIHL